jgi:hypothetical protein
MKIKELLIETKLGNFTEIKTNFPDADFWLVRKGSENSVGKPVKDFTPEHIGIKVLHTDKIDSNYLYYVFLNLFNKGFWKQFMQGTLNLKSIRTDDVKNLGLSLSESWSKKYKKSINCSNPKGFSQRAHCAGRKARQVGKHTKSKSVN